MSNLTTLPKGDSAWLLRRAIERIIQQVSVLETNIGSSTTGNSANTQVIFNDNGVLRGDVGLAYSSSTAALTIGGNVQAASATITGDLTVDTNTLKVDSANNRVYIGTTAAVLSEKFNVSSSSADTYALMQQGSGITALFGVNATGAYSGSYTNQPYLFLANNIEQYRISPLGVFTWTDGAGGTRMTLNSTGLGVGVSPSDKLSVNGGASFSGFGINANPLNPVSTSQRQARFQNTGGDFYFGIESSSAGGFFPGSTAYATCFYNATATPLQFFTNGSLKATIDTSGNLILRSSATPATLATNGELTVNATSNTNLRFSYRGSDGVTRVANLTLA